MLNNFEKQTNVPKVYVVLGLGALYFFLVFFNIAADFLVKTIGFAIPAYYSLEALFTTKSSDDTQVSLSDDIKNNPLNMQY
jgi:receptor expression-enhancing protein 5/6